MVLTSHNSGKYLMPKWHRDQALAIADRTQFTQQELDWLEIGPDEGKSSRYNNENFQTDTTPIDPLTEPRRRDIRNGYDKG